MNKKVSISHQIPPIFPDNSWVAIDTEFFRMNEKTLHRPTSGKFACMTVCAEPHMVYMITDEKMIQHVLDRLDNCVWVMHHAKFDITQLRRYATIPPRRRLWDTLLIERILYGGYYDFFGLEHLARRHLHEYLDKSLQKAFATTDEMTPEMEQYSVIDASVTLRVAREQKRLVTREDFGVWKGIDLPALWAVLDFRGFRLDVGAWERLAKLNEQRQKDIATQLSFNPNSPQQVLKALRKAGYKRLPSTGAKVLERWMRKQPKPPATELAETVLEARMYQTRASRYGMNFINDHLEEEENDVQVIHGDYKVTGAETGRMACKKPNMQNIIKRKTNEFRECYISRPGNVLLIADFPAQEVRISAHLSGDENLKKIFRSGEDIYIEVARESFGETITKNSKRRDVIKSLVLGTDYGMTPEGLALREDIPVIEAEELVDGYFSAFPDLKRWMDNQQKETVAVKTVMDRKCWLNYYSDQCERNALNSPIQGSGGDMLKMALGRIYSEWNFDVSFACVGAIHDELVFDVPSEKAKEISLFVREIMEEVGEKMCPDLNWKVDVIQGNSWGAKS